MNERPDGVYIVTINGKPKNTVGLWGRVNADDTEKHWRIPGIDRLLDDKDLLQIGERIARRDGEEKT